MFAFPWRENFLKREEIQQTDILHKHGEPIPLRNRAKPCWVSYCMSAVRVGKPAAAGAAFQARLFIVGRILLFGFCSPSPSPAPQAVKPEPRKSEGRWQLSGHWGLDRPPRLKGSGISASWPLIHYHKTGSMTTEELHPKEGLRLTALTRA